MRAVARNWPGGYAPVDPQESERTVTQSELIRFRLTTAEKQQISAAALRAETSVSALVRRAARAAAAGRLADRQLLADLVSVRRIANHLLSLAENSVSVSPALADKLRQAVTDLRRIVARHLEEPL